MKYQLTGEPPSAAVPPPPLQDEERVRPLGHPQSPGQQHLLRVDPHFCPLPKALLRALRGTQARESAGQRPECRRARAVSPPGKRQEKALKPPRESRKHRADVVVFTQSDDCTLLPGVRPLPCARCVMTSTCLQFMKR